MLNFINIAAKKPLQAFMIGFACFSVGGAFFAAIFAFCVIALR